jgi:hypothetical protein
MIRVPSRVRCRHWLNLPLREKRRTRSRLPLRRGDKSKNDSLWEEDYSESSREGVWWEGELLSPFEDWDLDSLVNLSVRKLSSTLFAMEVVRRFAQLLGSWFIWRNWVVVKLSS